MRRLALFAPVPVSKIDHADRGRRLAAVVKAFDVNITKIAGMTGVSRAAVHSWLRGEPPLENNFREFVANAAQEYGFDPSEVLGAEPRISLQRRTLPYRGMVSAGSFTEPGRAQEEIEVPAELYVESGYVLTVDGVSMHPTLVMGERIIVKPASTASIRDVVVAQTPDDRTTLKRLRYDDASHKYVLKGDNPEDSSFKAEECQIIAKAIWSYKSL